ncbi:ATP-binding protein [Tolumonas lignilytica]|jgi:Signal transduction histidine kinase|uniref:ATP-binding protein n=1 Tax=Tolumonas lignilytica TaxID=1283284 RepID=UPI0004668360|nr:ATP-binding protein [Tolumonas lignilytica]
MTVELPSFWRRWLPQSITAQILLLALAGLILAQVLGLQIYRSERDAALGLVNSRNAMIRLSSVVRLLSSSPDELHEEILRASRSETLMMRIQDVPLSPNEHNLEYETILRNLLDYPGNLSIQISAEQVDNNMPPPVIFQQMHQQMHARGRDVAGQIRPHNGLPPPLWLRDVRMYGAIELVDGRWLNFSSLADLEQPTWSPGALLSLLLVALLIGAVLFVLLRRATRPLKLLAQQAEHFGRGDAIPPLDESGPIEVTETLAAFNRMQTRLNRFVQDRTQMLAAISHDLRTPLTSLRLRCEFLPDGDDRDRMLQTLAQMENMLHATLSFARDEHKGETSRPVDLVSLLHSLCDDYEDNGQPVLCHAEGKRVYQCRPEVLRRVLQNLIGNALKYAGDAEVSLEETPTALFIRVRDHGGGIPEDQLESVFKPFFRLDTARNTEDGSVGLGLAIARTLIHQHGGELRLTNVPEGGLLAEIQLPV